MRSSTLDGTLGELSRVFGDHYVSHHFVQTQVDATSACELNNLAELAQQRTL